MVSECKGKKNKKFLKSYPQMSFLKPYTLKNSYKDRRKNRKSESNIEKSNANVIMMPGKILRPPKLRFFKQEESGKGILTA